MQLFVEEMVVVWTGPRLGESGGQVLQVFHRYSWPLNNTSLNSVGGLLHGYFSINAVNVFFSSL